MADFLNLTSPTDSAEEPEILSIVVPETKVAQLSKLTFLNKLKTSKLFSGSNRFSGLWRSPIVKGVDEALTALQKGKWCFVAGTLVATSMGLQAIETIEAGDEVWSRDQFTGEYGFREVTQTFESHPDELCHISMTVDGSSEEELVTTPEHPFAVASETGWEFRCAGELEPGDLLVLANESVATVARTWRERAPPGQTFTTYNLEVEDFHTYFVGEKGIWVHNTCSEGMNNVASLFEQLLKKNGSGKAGLKAAADEIEDMLSLTRKGGAIDEIDYVDAMSYVNLRLARGGEKLPTPKPWRHQGKGAADPRLAEKAAAKRQELGIHNRSGMNRNVAVAKVKVDGEEVFLAQANKKFPDGSGSVHSEELLAADIVALRNNGHKVEVEELFTERIPCTETGGCRRMIADHMDDAKVFFWISGDVRKSKAADLADLYGL